MNSAVTTTTTTTPVINNNTNTKKSHSKKRQRENNKDPTTHKSPRMQCTMCGKPAVRYYTKRNKEGQQGIIYEHRDEKPVREDTYHGKKFYRYRRCDAGKVIDASTLIEPNKEQEEKVELEEQQQQQPQAQPQPQQKQKQTSPRAPRHNSRDYVVEMIDSLKELDEIAHDISGEESKRILKNIWRWIENKRQEISRSE